MLIVKTLLAKILGAIKADYIIEEGTSGNWTYRKWASGKYEAWYYGAINITAINTSIGQRLPGSVSGGMQSMINAQYSGVGNGFVGVVKHGWVPADCIPVISADPAGQYILSFYVVYTLKP